MRDNPHESPTCAHLNWSNRELRVLESIISANSSIVMLQECRELPGYPFQSFALILKQMYGYDCMFHQNHRNPKIRVATFWKANEFVCIESQTYWLCPNYTSIKSAREWSGKKYPRPIGLNVLLPLATPNNNNHYHYQQNKALYVYNTHFGHDNKDFEIDITHKIMKECGGDHPSVLAADCNFFNSKNGLDQRRKLCNFHNTLYRLDDLTFYAPPLVYFPPQQPTPATSSSLTLIPTIPFGTFVGSSIDPHKPYPLGSVGDALDIIAAHNIKQYQSWVWNYLPSTYDINTRVVEDVYGSDHIPVVSHIVW